MSSNATKDLKKGEIFREFIFSLLFFLFIITIIIFFLQLHYWHASPVWRPHLIGDMYKLERVQKRATKYILNDYSSDYRSRLIALDLLPLMFELELQDIMFCIKSLKSTSGHFSIMEYISFNQNHTRSGDGNKMSHSRSHLNSSRHYYFNRLPRMWNALPTINLDLSTKRNLTKFFTDHFIRKFSSADMFLSCLLSML